MLVRNSLAKALTILVCSLVSLSCGAGRNKAQTETEKLQPPKTYVFECLNKASFTVRFEKDQASMFLPVGTIFLPRVPSSAGAKYSDGKTSIWQRGETALLTLGGKPLGDCVNNSKAAAWEHARLNGVNFRAAGDTPGWYLEITDQKDIIFAAADNNRRFEFPFADAKTNNTNLTKTYETKTSGHQLTAVIVEMECQDAITKKVFNSTVSVKVDGKNYRGCGKTLQ